MKITKHYLNKEVRVTWLDPFEDRFHLVDAKKGKAALAKWIERGVIDDVTDGVVRLVKSQGYSPGESEPNEGIYGWIQEDLIETCEIMAPQKEEI